MKISFNKILVLAPHTDDGEFGCGGLMSKAIKEGAEVLCIAFSDCKESVPKGLEKDILRKEFAESMTSYGISGNVLNYKVRMFPDQRQDILQEMVDINKAFSPDLVLTPCSMDIHQDHQVIHSESLRAFKQSTIWGYELPWNCFSLPSDVVVGLSESDIDQKIRAIQCYKSQSERSYLDSDYMKALALTRGRRINSQYAEAYESLRFVYK